MSDDPAHKAMLYFLEVLMNSNGPLTISQLAGRFGSRNFTSEMRTAAGGNESGLKKFLLKYPSLFTVRGNMVSLFDGKSTPGTDPDDPDSGSTDGRMPLPDVSTELAAVQYFQQKLVKKEEKWVQIRSLAGHLSQAEAHIRNVVGPQLEFRNWLLRHPHIFDVQGELVGLKDGVAAVATPAIPRRCITFDDSPPMVKPVPPKTPPATRRMPKSPGLIRRSHSFSDKSQALQNSRPTEPTETSPSLVLRRSEAPVTMTANEYKAVTFLKEIIEKKGPIPVPSILTHLGTAPEGVKTTIGWTKPEYDDFLQKNSTVFMIEDDKVNIVKNAKLNVIITGSRPTAGGTARTLNGRKGKVFHVAKLWGIIDLGKHEHVFFDKSIMRRPIDDLSKEYKSGDILCFHAVLAPKSSRAKWRATHVWRETEAHPTGSQMDLSLLDTPSSSNPSSAPLSPANSIEAEINRFLPPDASEPTTPCEPAKASPAANEKFKDAAPSLSGSVSIFSKSGKSDKLVDEQKQLTTSPVTAPAPPLTNGVLSNGKSEVTTKVTAEIGCQTISTGDIIATHLYYED